MKNIIVLVCSITLMANCVEKKKEPKEPTIEDILVEDTIPTKANDTEKVILDKSSFKANGSEPLWDLKLFEDHFELDMNEMQSTAALTEPITLDGSNLRMYRIKNDAAAIDIIIAQKECIDSITNKKSPYTVTISYKDTDKNTATILEGCGSYVIDYRLHDMWVLHKINGKQLSTMNVKGKDLPFLEIDTRTNRFSGMAGCNRMAGGITFEKDALRFSEAMVTKMACPNLKLETEFLELLPHVVSYHIEDNKLYLYDESQQPLLQFKKTD
ncbi:META domain-containing protein [Muricauda sp. JGD-17]|uniref:META domain-containing protein n=1 Tax=Flagellimonas ochracea TaxID=2696472 RepID=A0A964TBK7_9FLAO|nr:META domain-containing protein [Allomuricauda ochracea]NAY91860.1 META domain-containing protein [Allomuricauda ochracea]